MLKKLLLIFLTFTIGTNLSAQINVFQFSSSCTKQSAAQSSKLDSINTKLSRYVIDSTSKEYSNKAYLQQYNAIIERSIKEPDVSISMLELDKLSRNLDKAPGTKINPDSLLVIKNLLAAKLVIAKSDTVNPKDTTAAAVAANCKISVNTTKIINGDYQVLVYDSVTSNKEVFRAPLQREAFNAQLDDALKRLRPALSDSDCLKSILNQVTEREFRKFLEIALATDKLSPQAGTIYLKRTVELHYPPRTVKSDSTTKALSAALYKSKKEKSTVRQQNAILQSTLATNRSLKLSLKKAKRLEDKIKKVQAKIAAIKDSTQLDIDTAKNPKKQSVDTLKEAPGKSKTTGYLYSIPGHIIPGKELASGSDFPFLADSITTDTVKSRTNAGTPAIDTSKKQTYVSYSNDSIQLVSGSIQIQDGFIENIQVIAISRNSGLQIRYENGVSIPFSTKYDFNRLNQYRLYLFNNPRRSYILLSDVLRYAPTYKVNRRDYCPADTVLELNFTKPVEEHVVFKLGTHQIFSVSTFTDLMGVAEDKPNGLVQLEIFRQTNLWTNRWQVKNSGWGVFNYITPYFTQSKIENKERRLVTSPDSSNTIKFTTYLKLLEYQLFNTGFIQNIAIWDVPRAKSLFHFNFGLSYGRTAMRDTLFNTDSLLVGKAIATGTENFGINTLQFAPQITWDIRPDERYGFLITDRIHLITAFTEKIRVIGNKNVIQNNKTLEINEMSSLNKDQGKFGVVNTFELFAFFKPVKAEDHKLYFRYRLNSDLHNFKFNYHQLQIGYSFYLTTK